MLCWVSVAVCDDQDAGNGDGDGEDLVPAQLLSEHGHRESVGEECGAIVNRGQVRRSGHADRDVPTSTSDGESGSDEGRGAYQIWPRVDMTVALGGIDVAELDHESGCANVLVVTLPNRVPGRVPLLDANDSELEEPQHEPGAVGEVTADGLISVRTAKKGLEN